MKETLKKFWNYYKSSKLAWFITAVIVVVIVVVARHGSSTSATANFVVAKTNVVDSVVLSGSTESASAVNLGFADQGRVAHVYVKEGDHVTAGELLAELDTSDLDASLKNAEASLTIAQAGVGTTNTNLATVTAQQNALVASAYNTLLSGSLQAIPNNTNTVASLAPVITGNYTGPEGDYVIHFYSSSANSGISFDVQGLETGYANTVTSNTTVPLGTRGLFIQFGSSVQGYANTDWTVSVPNKRSTSYTANYNAYVSAQAARDQAITAAQSDLVTTSADQSIAEAKVQQAQASVDGILSQISDRKIVAPFDGVVATVDLKPGQSTTVSDVGGASTSATGDDSNTIRLISENDYEVQLNVPEIDVAKVSVGQNVAITLDAYGDTVFPGTVTSVDPAETQLEGVPVYETKVAFTKPDSRIRSGMTATATIVASEHDGVLAVPVAVLHTDTGGSYVYVVSSDDKTTKQAVTTGLRGSDSMIEITSGLSEGQTISADPLQ